MPASLPKISIVTPSFNQGIYLEQTILSILEQNYPNLEYIVIDGGSSDNSIDIIKKYEKYLSYWVSEPDKGQSDAINKGLLKASGQIFNWINSDDILEKGALFKIAEAFVESNFMAYCGSTVTFGTKAIVLPPAYRKGESLLQAARRYNYNQPGTFFNMNTIRRLGGKVDSKLHFVMDHDLWFRFLALYGVTHIVSTTDVLAKFRIHDSSKTYTSRQRFMDEYASYLFSMAKQISLHKLLPLLQLSAKIDTAVQLDMAIVDRFPEKIIEQKIWLFLVKRSYIVNTRYDHELARKVFTAIDWNEFTGLDDEEKKWVDVLRKNAAQSSWLMFRIKRKIDHLLFK